MTNTIFPDHCYRLDGKLVAIGVLDLLPTCVSSVYFLYHESIHKYNPGKLGALREIALAAEQGYRWWYAGYYIHTCPKMRYKISFSPTYILDPDSYRWISFDEELCTMFDGRGYLNLPPSKDIDVQSPSQPGHSTASGVKNEREDGSVTEDPDNESIFASHMPGLMSSEQVRSLDLDRVLACLGSRYFFAEDLFSNWRAGSVDDSSSPKSMVAGLAALIGPDLLQSTCLDLRKSS